MNRDSCDMRRAKRNWGNWSPENRPVIGDFDISDQLWPGTSFRIMYMMLPCGFVCSIPVNHGPPSGMAWGWDGSEDRPTLTPSVWHYSDPDWHGFIRAGRMESC